MVKNILKSIIFPNNILVGVRFGNAVGVWKVIAINKINKVRRLGFGVAFLSALFFKRESLKNRTVLRRSLFL